MTGLRTRRLSSLSEQELVRWVFDSVPSIYAVFGFALDKMLGLSARDWTVEVWLGVDRAVFGLDPQRKPGDIDVLMVPKFEEDRFAERAVAIEVKRGLSPRSNRARSLNSFGVRQAVGLLRDGFPFVGVAHIVLAEPSANRERVSVPVHRLGVMTREEAETPIGHALVDLGPLEVADRHEGRLRKFLDMDACGYNSQIFGLNRTGTGVISRSVNHFRQPSKNPLADEALIGRLRDLSIPPDVRLSIFWGGIDLRWRDTFLEPSPLDRVTTS